LPLLDSDGMAVGKLDDVVIAPSAPGDAPRALGLVALMQRRRIFINGNRIDEVSTSGVRLHGGTVDLRRFELRSGELLANSLINKSVGGEVVNDLAIARASDGSGWHVVSVALSAAGILRRRSGRVVDWRDVPTLFDVGSAARQVAALSELHPADLATRIIALPLERRRALAEAMDDERLADLLEELPEDEQRELIAGLDLERAADVIEEMEVDDAADLLSEMSVAERNELLAAMEPEEADPIRRLLAYEGDTAGGLMTPEPLVLTPQTTVAEALARIRHPDLPSALAAQVFVAEAPTATPTGRFLGTVPFQRLLREGPGTVVGECVDDEPKPVGPGLSELEVARRLAAYNAIAVPVCDDAGRLVGAVTVDDVLDRVLPADWRGR
ncbi:MAG: magnesium transporter, partial [Actinobacteria bacterium]|nr:magnesium transporter [Actinomycetota bacterium]